MEEPVQLRQLPVLLTADGRVQLNKTAAAILRLCNGSLDREAIIAAVVRRSRGHIQSSDIGEFLDVALARGWISLNGKAP